MNASGTVATSSEREHEREQGENASAPRTSLRQREMRVPLLLLCALVFADFALLGIEAANRASGLYLPALLLEAEANIPTWFSVVQLFSVGVLAAVLAGTTTGRLRLAWAVIALGFMALSLDDGAALHERIDEALAREGSPAVWPVIFFVPGVVVLYALWTSLDDVRRRFPPARTLLIAGVGLLALAVVVDTFLPAVLSPDTPEIRTGASIEELLEMLGASLMIGAFLSALWASVRLRRA